MDKSSSDFCDSKPAGFGGHILSFDLMSSTFDRDLYELSGEVEQKQITSIKVEEGVKKRSATSKIEEKPAKRRLLEAPSTASDSHIDNSGSSANNNNNVVKCSVCQISVLGKYINDHMNGIAHKIKVTKSFEQFPNFQVIESAFDNRISTYRINSDTISNGTFETPEIFLQKIKDVVHKLLEPIIVEHKAAKVNFILYANFVQQSKNKNDTFNFQTSNYTINQGYALNDFYLNLIDTLVSKTTAFKKNGSGWSLHNIKCIDININKFNPLCASSYIDLPRDIKNKKGVINVKNKDNLCFKWALLSALYPVNKNVHRVSSYEAHVNKLKFDGISFPVKLTDVAKVEKLNNISINIFGLEYNEEKQCNRIVGPLFLTKCRKAKHINLLYITDGNNNHYCYISNLSRLVSKQISSHCHKTYLCDSCLLHFSTQEALNNHQQYDCVHICSELPTSKKYRKNWFGVQTSNDKLKFDNYQNKLKVPFVVYADFKAFLDPINKNKNDPSKPNNTQKHEVYSFGYFIKCSFDDSLSKYETYTGPNCTEIFMERLCCDLKQIVNKNNFSKSPITLTGGEREQISNIKICHICQTDLREEEFHDFDWYTGAFRGVAHKLCSYKFKKPRHIPVVLHNLNHYDAQFIVNALNIHDGDIEIIPENKDHYISFSKKIQINSQQISLRFIDSFKFLSSSVDQIAVNLDDEQCVELNRHFPNREDFIKLRRKGVYPYEYMTDYNRLKLTSLPKKSQFYSSITNLHISNDDYNHAKNVWHHFKCCSMADYFNLFLKTNVILLVDVFENFRNLCLATYDLDPTHYYTAAGFGWDAMLKYTKIELHLLTDYDKIAFIKAGLRGGVAQCSHLYAKANNIFMHDYDTETPSSFITYLQANNLYGWAMSQFLPVGRFDWVDSTTDFNVSDTSDIGYILEVDLEYPDFLHDLHSDFPLCPENIVVGNTNETQLVPNLNNKFKYVIHYRNLKQCISLGMKLTKIHRVLKFKQSPWLKKYIDLNTNLTTLANSDFEKNFYRLMIDSLYGKTIENIEKRVNVKLVRSWENEGYASGAQRLISKPEFLSSSVFSNNLVAVQSRKTKLIYNKPNYLGFCISDISKTLMYDFHFNYMTKKFKNKIKLQYTDTDCLIYHICTNNFYLDIKSDLNQYFDTSGYETDNIFGYPKINKNKLGFFKDEYNGKIVKEFVGLRSKIYALEF